MRSLLFLKNIFLFYTMTKTFSIGDRVKSLITDSTDTGVVVTIDHLNSPDSWYYIMPIGVNLDELLCVYWNSEDQLEVSGDT